MAIYSGFSIGTFFFSYKIFSYLDGVAKVHIFLIHQFMSIIFYIFFITINIGNIVVSYSTLYKSEEVNFLFYKPISPLKIFVIKFFDNFFYSSSTLTLIVFSLLGGYAVYFNLSFVSYLLIILNLLPFMICAGIIGVIELLLLMKLISRIGLKKLIISIVILYILSIILFFEFYSPIAITKQLLSTNMDFTNYFGGYVPYFFKYLPNNWMAELIYNFNVGDYYVALQWSFLLIIFTVLLFIIALLIAQKWYKKSWYESYDFKFKSKVKNHSNNYFEKTNFLNKQFDALIKKDISLFFRQPSQVLHFLILLFFIAAFIISLSYSDFNQFENIYLKTISFLTIFLFNLLLIITISLRFIFPLVSLEGKQFWALRTSPLNYIKYIQFKLIPYLIISIVIVVILSKISTDKFSDSLFLPFLFINIFVAINIMLINFTMGAIYPKYSEPNPVRIASSQGASITFLLAIIYVILSLTLLVIPVYKFFINKFRYDIIDLGDTYFAMIIICLVSIGFSIIFYKLGINSLKKDF